MKSIRQAATSVRRAGTRALLLEFGALETVLAAHQQLSRKPLPGQEDLVAAARTVMIRFSSSAALTAGRDLLDRMPLPERQHGEAREVTIDVVYDGEDLPEVAEALGMGVQELVEWHTSRIWTGSFGGFAPGFTYCVPASGAMQIPRRSSPRTAVPPGSVALAGEFSAVYPRRSPGGWQLIGRTGAAMWDLARESPALVRPGDTVRYRAVEHLPPPGEPDPASELPSPDGAALTVVSPGVQTLVQDFGRPGLSDLGVSRAGVADEAAAAQANRLVGNAKQAPVLETLMGGLTLRADQTLVLGASGAEVQLSITGRSGPRTAPVSAPFVLLEGETLTLGMPLRGLRTVVAVRGGIEAAPVLGSASSDTMSGLGPAPLQADQPLRISSPKGLTPVGGPERPTLFIPDTAGRAVLRFTYGPREDWFGAAERTRLHSQDWQVTAEADRIGIRLAPDPADPEARSLRRAKHEELPSEGVPRGSLQVPPEGSPVLFLNDHPVTAGYPVIGVVVPEDLSAAAQLGPGDTVALQPVNPDTLAPTDSLEARP
ncbi:carboxyltransferase domain-containing protein [Nesterenkonia populi]|uniref:5-oxoprolinase subunit B/C family protein n=1 Tax=Nesterenkonia populi TaxID=1591087 RepID=UPI0011BE2C4B|nr:carboxyltransferase domain-containing protein [Nesterenkonia populi]